MTDTRLMAWPQAYLDFFQPDGALRDIVVADTTVGDWKTFAQFLGSSSYEISLSFGGQERALPEDIVAFLQARGADEEVPVLSITVGRLLVQTWFWWEKSIDMTICPNEVTDREQYGALLRFMQEVSDALNKPAVLTPGDDEATPLIRMVPEGAPEFFPENGAVASPTRWTFSRRK